MMNRNTILVSIICDVYNHEPYIFQCLEGFIIQKTNFKFEVLIHDDASTDKSADIIRKYVNKYPGISKPIYEKENQYSKGIDIWKEYQFPRVKGKYIAICEGDDYWTDPYKLQKQFDFMEAHPEYSLCFHNAIVHYENSDKADRLFAELEDREYTRQELTKKWLAPTASFFFRASVIESSLYQNISHNKYILCGDLALMLTASYSGKIYGMSKVISVYRKHESGIMNTFKNHHFELCCQFIEFRKIFGKDLSPTFNRIIATYSVLGISDILHNNFVSGIKSFSLAFINSPLDSIRLIFYYYRKRK